MIRNTPYMKKDKYSKIEILKEEPREIYLTSAYYKSNWYFKQSMDALSDMYKGKALLFSTDYSLCLKHNIKSRAQLIRAKRQAGTDSWDMEYKNIPLSISEDAFYPYNLLDKAQCLTVPFLPRTTEQFLTKQKGMFNNIPRLPGEKRILAMDLAISASTKKKKNDYSSVKLIRAIPSNGFYERQEVYAEEYEGKSMLDQATRTRFLMYEWNCDMFVFDAKNLGISFVDEMAKPIYDEERKIEYPPIRCWNIDELSERCRNNTALPLMYGYMGDAKKNHNGHMTLKGRLKEGAYKFLCTYLKGIDILKEDRDYNLGSLDYQAYCETAFIQSDATVNEMVQLETEFVQGSYLKLFESSTGTKDKYMATMMGNYYIQYELDVLLSMEDEEDDDEEEDYSSSVGRLGWYSQV